MGLAFAKTGVLYPFFGTCSGWLGVALTGSDTASNVLFGSLQRITAEQIGLEPDADGGGEQLGRRDGQDDRRAEHRGGQHRDGLVRPRRRHPALRVFHSVALAVWWACWSSCRRTFRRSPGWWSAAERLSTEALTETVRGDLPQTETSPGRGSPL